MQLQCKNVNGWQWPFFHDWKKECPNSQSQFLINSVVKKSQNKIRIHVTKQHRYNTNQTTLISDNLTVMVVLIPLVGILGNPYKIPITTRNTLGYIIKMGY